MKSARLHISTITLIAALACSCGGAEKQENKAPKQMAAPAPAAAVKPAAEADMDVVLVTVNGKQFTRRMAAEMVREMALRQGVPPQMADQYIARGGQELLRRSTDQFIDQTLIKAELDRRADKIADADIEKAVEKISEGLPEGMTLTNALSARGMTMAELREQIVANERMKKLFDVESPSSNAVTDAQVETFYKENDKYFKTEESAEARHILISCKADADAAAKTAAKACADSVRTQLVAGADFAKLAAATSACPSKAKGGDLGKIRRGQMVPPFEKAVFEQEINAIGPVVETDFGFHVVQVTKRQPAGVTPLGEVSGKIREHLDVQSREKKFAEYVKGLRSSATIVYPQAAEKSPAADKAPAAAEPAK